MARRRKARVQPVRVELALVEPVPGPGARRGARPPVGADVRGPVDVPGRERPPRRAPEPGTTLRAQPPRQPEQCSAAASSGCQLRAPPDPAPPGPVSRGQEEVVRLDLTRQHVKAFRSRHGAAQAPRHEGRRVLRDPPPRLASSHTTGSTGTAASPRRMRPRSARPTWA